MALGLKLAVLLRGSRHGTSYYAILPFVTRVRGDIERFLPLSGSGSQWAGTVAFPFPRI